VSGGRPAPPDLDAETRRVGLCVGCARARLLVSAKGSRFYRCEHAARDSTFAAYPPLPVRSCTAYAARPEGDGITPAPDGDGAA
jgi:hypothetical protein